MDDFNTVETLPDGALPKLRVKGPTVLDDGKIKTNGNGVLTVGGLILPTADPHVVNALWNHAGVLTISAG